MYKNPNSQTSTVIPNMAVCTIGTSTTVGVSDTNFDAAFMSLRAKFIYEHKQHMNKKNIPAPTHKQIASVWYLLLPSASLSSRSWYSNQANTPPSTRPAKVPIIINQTIIKENHHLEREKMHGVIVERATASM